MRIYLRLIINLLHCRKQQREYFALPIEGVSLRVRDQKSYFFLWKRLKCFLEMEV